MNERIPNIMKSVKSSITRIILQRHPNIEFAWQRSYHDRIIWDESNIARIRKYIIFNAKIHMSRKR